MLNLLHFLPELGALYAFIKFTPVHWLEEGPAGTQNNSDNKRMVNAIKVEILSQAAI
jgi:hypothetical protein